MRCAAPRPRRRAPARAAAPASLPAAVAAAGLGAVSEEDGVVHRHLRRPAQDGIPEYVPFSTAPVTVSREEAAPEPRPAAAPRGARTPGDRRRRRRRPPAAGGGGRQGDDDEAFEDLYDRLKRELLIEQEQLGQPFHEPEP